jgi:hypothetical protein
LKFKNLVKKANTDKCAVLQFVARTFPKCVLCNFIYVFISGLFNAPDSSSDYTGLNDRMINELEMIQKEAVQAKIST